MRTEFEIENIYVNFEARHNVTEIATGRISVGPIRLKVEMRSLSGDVIVHGAQINDQRLLTDIGIAVRARVLARIGELFARGGAVAYG